MPWACTMAPKILDIIASKGEVRNVTCTLTWTGGTANTPLQADITMALVTAFAMDMYMSNAMLQPSASDGKPEDGAAGSQGSVESAEPATALSESVTKKREIDIPKYVPKWYNIPIALTSTTTEPGKGEFRRLGMDAAVNGTWLAYKWAIEDGNAAAKAALESLILNWPFDFHLFQSDAADSAAPNLEDKILQLIVHIPFTDRALARLLRTRGQTPHDDCGPGARGDSHAEAVQGDPDVEGDTRVACSVYSAVFGQSAHGVEGGKPLC